jgi:hypothetical protein
MKCTIYFTVSREPNAYVVFCISKWLLRDKSSASEKPSDPSILMACAREKSPLVRSRAEAYPEAHSSQISEFSFLSRSLLSFLSDLYFGANPSPSQIGQKLIASGSTGSLSVLDSDHVAPRHPLLLLYLEARPGWTRVLRPHCALPTSPGFHTRPIIRCFSPRPNFICRRCRGHRYRSLAGR